MSADFSYLLHSGYKVEAGNEGLELCQRCARGACGLVIKPTLFPLVEKSLDQYVIIKKFCTRVSKAVKNANATQNGTDQRSSAPRGEPAF